MTYSNGIKTASKGMRQQEEFNPLQVKQKYQMVLEA